MNRALTISLALIGLHFLLVPCTFAQEADPAPKENTEGNANENAPKVDPALAAKLESPQATIRTFLQAKNLDDAAECLDLSHLTATSEAKKTKGPNLASQLKNIIDHLVFVQYEQISDDPDFKTTYNLAAQPIDDWEKREHASNIEITRSEDGLWRFSSETVDRLDDLYEQTRKYETIEGARQDVKKPLTLWLRDLFPEHLRQKHFILRDYQWICLLALIFIGFAADAIVRAILHSATAAWFKFIRNGAKAELERRVWRPVGLLAQALVWYGGTMLIDLPSLALSALEVAFKAFVAFALIWTGFRLIDLLARYLAHKAEGTSTQFDDLLIPMVSKTLKVFAVCIVVIVFAQTYELPISGLLGGLGLGGMAFVFASKDAIANLFGSVVVMVDRPFEIGDWIKTAGVEGTVESVGFRSTRIRTFYNSQVSLPNSQLTTASVDNMGRRRYRRITETLGVQYDTKPEQLEAFCEGIREILRRHPYTRKDYYHVYFNGFGENALNIMLYCFVECPDWNVELREKHRLYLDIVRLAQKLGVEFAFPTRTLHLYQEQATDGSLPMDFSDPKVAGKRIAAEIAGPLLPADQRPGFVEFRGPASFDDDDGGE